MSVGKSTCLRSVTYVGKWLHTLEGSGGLSLGVSSEQGSKHYCDLGIPLYQGLGVCACLGDRRKEVHWWRN